ncbi:MAG: hypothetical protein ABI024_14075 [Vicinamibacterales bacterium]
MKTGLALVVALGIGVGMTAVSARAQGDGKKYDKGATVTLQGCVVAAEKKGTYVLTNVREWPVGNSDMGKFGKRYYWIDKAGKDMKAHMGHTIQLIGKISDVEKSEIEFKTGENGMGMNVEIEGPGRDVRTPATNANVNAAGAVAGKNDIPITLLKLKVEEIKMTAPTCTPTM